MADPKETEPFEAVLTALPLPVYTTDAAGRITFYNEEAAALWGRRPVLGEERFCGSWRIYLINGQLLPHDRSPVARALKGEWPKNPIGFIERPDGTRTFCRSEVKLIHDVSGHVLGAVNVMIDLAGVSQGSKADIEGAVEAERSAAESQELVARLSERQRQVMKGIVAGQSTKEIARRLGLSPRTIEVHRRSLMLKVHARSVAELVRLSLRVHL